MPQEPTTPFYLPQDIRTWTKDQAKNFLAQSERTYLAARGWTSLIGVKDKFLLPPNCSEYEVKTYYNLEDALELQKIADES
jgi:hypothetical protein